MVVRTRKINDTAIFITVNQRTNSIELADLSLKLERYEFHYLTTNLNANFPKERAFTQREFYYFAVLQRWLYF